MASPPFVIDTASPTDSDFRSIYPANERNFRDIVDSWLKFDHNTSGGHDQVSLKDMVASEPTFDTDVMGLYHADGAIYVRFEGGTPVDISSFSFKGITGTGIVVKTGDFSAVVRTLTAGASGIEIENGNGVDGVPTISLSDNLQELQEVATAGFISRNASGTIWNARTLTAGNTGITIADGNGISDNPTFSLAVHQGTGIGNTDFPVGHMVIVSSVTLPNRNATVTVRLSQGDSRGYSDSGSGDLLEGTWRSRGSWLDTGAGGTSFFLAQRVA